jgi:hypothetical protein
MATSKVKRSHSAAQSGGRRLNPHTKTRFYEAAYDLNRGFALTLEVFDRLERLGLCRPDRIKGYKNMAEEVRALTNFQIAAMLRDREDRESAIYGRLRREFEMEEPPVQGKPRMGKQDPKNQNPPRRHSVQAKPFSRE